MQPLYFATGNKWKFLRAKDYFAQKSITLQQFTIELPESRNEDVCKIAKEKAGLAFSKLKQPLFVLDGALHIKALNDFPKTYVKFIDKYLGAEGLLKLLQGKKDRRWEFVNLIYYKDTEIEKSFPGILRGTVVKKLVDSQNNYVRDFDRILLPEGHKKTCGGMTPKEVEEFDSLVWLPTVFDAFISWLKRKKQDSVVQ